MGSRARNVPVYRKADVFSYPTKVDDFGVFNDFCTKPSSQKTKQSTILTINKWMFPKNRGKIGVPLFLDKLYFMENPIKNGMIWGPPITQINGRNIDLKFTISPPGCQEFVGCY